MVDLVDRLSVMLQKEQSNYATKDYMAADFQKKLFPVCDLDFLADGMNSNATGSFTSSSSSGINDIWREKICEWSYQVIDHFDFSREIVSVSIHYLDRYLATRPVNKKVFQLAAMTTLFLAIKLFEPGRLGMKSMIELSRGYFTVEQMSAMEMSILRALNWHVHPPTAYCFSKHILFLLPYKALSRDVRHDIFELARFLTELSVIDYYFVNHRPSAVALAAIINSMEDLPAAVGAIPELIYHVETSTDLDTNSQSVSDCRNRLRLLYVQGGYARPNTIAQGPRDESISPVCVSYGCQP